jgi:hypothetical protein
MKNQLLSLALLSGTVNLLAQNTQPAPPPTVSYAEQNQKEKQRDASLKHDDLQRDQVEKYQTMAQILGANTGVYDTFLKFDHSYEGVKGTAFLSNGWIEARILMKDGTWKENQKAKYDAYNKQLRILRPQGDSLEVFPHTILGFQITDQNTLGKINFMRADNMKTEEIDNTFSGYLAILHSGKVGLLKNYSKTIKKASYKDAYSAGVKYDEVVDNSDLYVRNTQNVLVKVKANSKSLIKALADKEMAIKKYIDDKKLKCKTEYEMVEVLKYYETLP